MPTERRLTAEMRSDMKQSFRNLNPPKIGEMLDALHDLDVLEGENEELKIMIQTAPSPQQVKKLHEELAAAQDTIRQQGEKVREQKDEICELHRLRQGQEAVIAAMREALDASHRFWGDRGCVCVHCQGQGIHKEGCILANTNHAQLAADHEARIRADERRKVLEEVT